jgi:type IV fimbrial biogenesis protein FimT
MLRDAQGARGFTLLEVLLALGFFAIVAAIAFPNWRAHLPSYRLNSAIRQVQSELHRAKSRAVSKKSRFRLVFSTLGYSVEKETGGTYQPTGENKPLPEGIDIRSTTVAALGFTTRGTPTPGTGGTVKLCNINNAGKNIVVSGTGRIRICKPNVCNENC